MKLTLFGIDIKDSALLRRQRGRIVLHRAARHGCRHNRADVERLFALCLAGRCAEITQRPHNRIAHTQDHGRSLEHVRHKQPGIAP